MKLEYDVTGDGPPLVLLHGLGTSRKTWDDVLPALAAHHRVYRIDLKGFGASPKPENGGYSVFDQAAAVRALTDELGLETMTLVGHSLGGAVSLVLAGQEPERCPRLVLISSPGYSNDVPMMLRLARLRPSQGLVRNVPTRVALPFVLYRVYGNWDVLTPERVGAHERALSSPEVRHAVLQTALDNTGDEIEQLDREHHRITMPTLLIWGAKDRIISVKSGQRLVEDLPDARLVILPKCGHVPQEEWPEETAGTILDFLSECHTEGEC